MMHSCFIQAVFYNNPDTYPPIINSARLVAQAGHAYHLLCRDNGENWGIAYPPAVQIERIDSRGGGSWREYLAFVVRVLQRGNPSARVFIGHDMHGFLPAKLLATRHRVPLIYHCHDFADRKIPLALGGRVVRLFEQWFARTANLVIVPDAARGEVVKQQLHLPNNLVIVANAPLNQPIQRTGQLKRALAAQGFQWERIVLRQGRIGGGHAIEATIRSIPLWTNQNAGFVVMGPSQPEYLNHLRTLAKSIGADQRFAILSQVSYDDLLSFTVDADIGHALYEPIHLNNLYIATASNKFLEYLACGIPVIVSSRHGMQALVEMHHCGLTADESSPKSIAGVINALLDNLGQADQMGLAARRAFEQIFCYERQFAPVLRIIDQMSGELANE